MSVKNILLVVSLFVLMFLIGFLFSERGRLVLTEDGRKIIEEKIHDDRRNILEIEHYNNNMVITTLGISEILTLCRCSIEMLREITPKGYILKE